MKELGITMFVMGCMMILCFAIGGYSERAKLQPALNSGIIANERSKAQIELCSQIINGLVSQGKFFVINVPAATSDDSGGI